MLRMENVLLWKPIVYCTARAKDKMKKCLEYPHSILERVMQRKLLGRSQVRFVNEFLI